MQKLPRVLATRSLTPSMISMLENRVELVPWDQPDGTIDGIYCYGHAQVDAPMLDRHRNVRVISNHGVGVDHIDLEAARARNIPVGNTPGVLDGAVADLAMALILAAGRQLVNSDRFARHPNTHAFSPSQNHGREIHGSTLGIVGLGNIGYQIARRARGFDMRILYYARNRRETAEKDLSATWCPLEGLLRQSDYVVLIVPLTPETRAMIGARELSWMKPTASLVNIARGPVVDTMALTEVMIQRKIFAAALDVTDPEPLPRDHPLLSLDNVTITPHLGSATIETRFRMAELSIRNLMAGLNGEPLVCRIA
jgi:glyoxylate reductase